MNQEKDCSHQCKCIYHDEGSNAMHITACCAGKCEICGRNIKFDLMDEHLKVCHSLDTPQMEDGVFYDLTTPANIKGKIFHHVQCEYRVSGHPDEYVVRGIPEGGEKVEPFVLKFSGRGKVISRKSDNQEGF